MPFKKRNIVIGVDGNYLHKAVVFYKSLSKVHNNFTLHLFCFDETTYLTTKKMKYKNIKLYHNSVFETKELLKIKSSKERLYEYYWASLPHLAKKVLDEQNCEFVALADADIMFFQSPEIIFEEFKNSDVIIQPNNYSSLYPEDFVRYGYYCSSFQCFRNNKNGKKVLNYWCNKCTEWCSRKYEKGKFGDQKYLDDWRIRFKKVREVSNVGTNIAPWNVQKYDISKENGVILINNKWPLVYYHFHSFKINLNNYNYILTGDRNLSYPIANDVIKFVYEPYVKLNIETIKELKKIATYRNYLTINPEGNYHVQKI